MQIARRIATWYDAGGGDTPTARDYVQDGLVAMWDGIENAGWGVHDPNATVWKDLCGNRDFRLVQNYSHFEKDAFSSDLKSSAPTYQYSAVGDFVITNNDAKTVECLFMARSFPYATEAVLINPNNGETRNSPSVSAMLFGWGHMIDAYGMRPIVSDCCVAYKVCYVCISNRTLAVVDGSVVSVFDSGALAMYGIANKTIIGNRVSGTTRKFDGVIHRLSFYSRALTAEEVAANYAIDKARFNLP